METKLVFPAKFTTMDRLIKPDLQILDVLFVKGQKCSQNFQDSEPHAYHARRCFYYNFIYPSIFSVCRPFSILPPLSTANFTLFLFKPCRQPPLCAPPDAVLVRSSMLPTEKASQDDLRYLFSKPGRHIFNDATLPISFVGFHVAEFLLSPPSKPLEMMDSFFPRAISRCGESEVTSLLRVAVENGISRVARPLIEAGADLKKMGSHEESLISLAVKSGKAESLQILIDAGCTIDSKVDLVLHVAAAMNRVDLMEILCSSFKDMIELNSVNPQGQTPLHLSAIHGQMEALQFLVTVGSEVDTTDHEGWTPLHYAANQGHAEAVEYLLSHSVYSKCAVTSEGKTAFDLAVVSSNSHHLYDSLQLRDSLHRAARINDVETMKGCLSQGAKVDGRDQNEWTSLHRAAFKGNLESVKILISHGAQVDAVDGAGYTPLLRAVEGGHGPVARYLLSNGAKASSKCVEGMGYNMLERLIKEQSFMVKLN